MAVGEEAAGSAPLPGHTEGQPAVAPGTRRDTSQTRSDFKAPAGELSCTNALTQTAAGEFILIPAGSD